MFSDRYFSIHSLNSLYSVVLASNALTVAIELIAASETELPSASLVCMTFVRLRTKLPYHFDKIVIAGTEINAKIESCQDKTNMKIKTPIAWTSERRKTFTFNVTWSPTRVVSLETNGKIE